MAGLGWQEVVIVVILGIFLVGIALPVFLVVRTLRHQSRHEALRERHVEEGKGDQPLYAGFWDRVGAALLDGLVLLVPIGAIYAAGRALAGGGSQIAASILMTLVWLAYTVILNGRGATLGKRWAGLRVVDATGAAPGVRRAAVRAVIPLAASVPGWFFLSEPVRVRPDGGLNIATGAMLLLAATWLIRAVDTLWMIWDPRKQTLHDKMARTFVVVVS